MNTRKSKYYESLPDDMKPKYDTKIQQCGGIDPYIIKEKELSVNRADFPEITLLDIGNYMVHTVSPYTKRAFKAYKSMEAYTFFESGFVLTLGASKMENMTILKGKVKHSQRMNKAPHNVWVLAKIDGEIICANCTCKAGLSGTCSHVGAICFAVMNIAESTETISVTDMLCKWNVPKFQEVSMSLVRNIKWTPSSSIVPTTVPQDSEPTFRDHCNSLTTFTDEEIDNFLNVIHLDGQESALRTLTKPDEIRRASSIKDEVFLASLYKADYKDNTLGELIEIGKRKALKISNDELKEVERLTIRRAKSKFWLALKRGRITGCSFRDCCITNLQSPSITTINRIINPIKNLDNVPSVKYQRKNKKKAINCYLNQIDVENHENVEYKEIGLIINPQYPYFAASSDGLVSCDCHGKGCIEVKCLKILESGESFDILTRKPKNMLNKIDEKYFVEKDHELYYKLQMQIHLAEAEYCELVIWSPVNTLILTVPVDTEFWNEAKEKAIKFHQNVIMPELLGKFFTQDRNGPSVANFDETHLENLGEEIGAECLELIGLEIEILGLDED